MRICSFILLTLLTLACSKEKKKAAYPLNPSETTQNFFKSASQLTVQVAYEPGAEPYTDILGGPLNSLPLFWFLEENLAALFSGRSNAPVINVPKALSEFNQLPAQNKTGWTLDDIMKLANAHRTGISSTGHSYFWVVFLNGHLQEGTQLKTGVIGLSIQGTTVLAVFKDVVKGTAAGLGPLMAVAVPKYVEQSTIVHEMGHALGLVNNGLPMKSSHHDTAHGAHCSNSDCVMFWQNEGTADAVAFAVKMSTSVSPVMFDAQCLKDSQEF